MSRYFKRKCHETRDDEFVDNTDPAKGDYKIRDIHGDTDDDILERINSKLKWFKEQKKKMTKCILHCKPSG